MSERRPILFCCSHSTGEANSSIALAGELARRGVEDLWFSSDEVHRAAVHDLADRSTIEFASMGEVNPRLALTALDDESYGKVMQRSRVKAIRARLRQLFDPEHHFTRYRQTDELVDRIAPALMVINRYCGYAIQVAMQRGIPFIITAPSLPSSLLDHSLPTSYPTPSSGLPLRMTRRQRVANALFRYRTRLLCVDPVILRRGVAFQKHMAEIGMDQKVFSGKAQTDRAELLLCFSVFGLDYPFPVPAKLHLVGSATPPVRDNPGDLETMEWLNDQNSVVYVAFGSVTRLDREQVQLMVDVVRRLGDQHQVLWVLAESQQRLLPGELPKNLRVVSWVNSQPSILNHPHVRAFLTHGGSNSFHEAIHFGKPVLVRPICIDQFDHAIRAIDSGVGLAVPGAHVMDAGEIHSKLMRLLGEASFTERAQHFADVLREAGGLGRAGDLVLQRLQQTQSQGE